MRKIFYSLFFILIANCTLIIDNCACQWSNYPLPYDGLAYTLGFYDVNTGVSCGHTILTTGEKLYYTSNSGINWVLASYPPEIRVLVDVQFVSSTTVYACGAENFNVNGVKIFSPGFNYLPVQLRIGITSKGITEKYSGYKTAFLKSTNSGASWIKVGVFDTLTGYMMNIHFFDANTGYALIDSNSVGNTRFYKTTNAGVNWQMIKLVEAGIKLDNMYFFDLNTGFVSGNKYMGGPASAYGAIYKTTNGGLNFVKTTFLRISTLYDFTFLNSSTGIAIGFGSPNGTKIYKTTNAGNQWDSVSFLANRVMDNIESIQNTGTAFAVGNVIDSLHVYETISTMKTTNHGANWVVKDINQNSYITGLSIIDQNNFFMSGGDLIYTQNFARIFKSTNGGNVFVNQIGGEIPALYSLHQNYPNPFNPVTKINFDVAGHPPYPPSKGELNVSLKIFDITGKEIATLVNEQLQPGSYEVTFDGSNLASGIYFYSLRSAGFTDTKRMLMVK